MDTKNLFKLNEWSKTTFSKRLINFQLLVEDNLDLYYVSKPVMLGHNGVFPKCFSLNSANSVTKKLWH